MEPRSDFPTETSSGDDTKDGLNDGDEDPWTPDPSDPEPSVDITVTEEDENVPIQSIVVTPDKTTGVENITVQVYDKDGNPVVGTLHYLTKIKKLSIS